MPSLKMSVAHQLGAEEAVKRIQRFGEMLKEKYDGQFKDLEENWVDNALQFALSTFGMKVKGQMNVEDDAVNIDGDLPFAAMMFKGKIEKDVREALEKILS